MPQTSLNKSVNGMPHNTLGLSEVPLAAQSAASMNIREPLLSDLTTGTHSVLEKINHRWR